MKTQITRILVPTDFSEQAKRAYAYAVALARTSHAAVDLLHVWEPPRYVAPDLMLAVPGWSAVTLEQYSRTAAAKELEVFLSQVDREGVKVTHHLEVGEASASILRYAADKKADLLVMGTHGRGALARLVLGSVTQKVVARASCPVLTVRTPDGEAADAA